MYRCHRTASSIAAAALMAAAAIAFLPAGARAATAVLWACHGPGGQSLGSSPFTSESSGDGLTPPAGCSGAGGLEATFSRPDPLVGSIAAWQLPLPDGVALQSVTFTRSTTGFGGATPGSSGPLIPGDSLIYSAGTSPAPRPSPYYVLEQSSLDGSPTLYGPGQNLWLDGEATITPLVLGGYLRLQVMCAAGNEEGGARCGPPTGGAVPGVNVSAVALTVSDDAAPHLAIGGLQSPAAGTLQLYLSATDDGLGLAGVTARIDGIAAGALQLSGPECTPLSAPGATIALPLNAVEDNSCPRAVSTSLAVDTHVVADGSHQLQVIVTDAAGVTSVFSETIQILNTRQQQSNTATIGVGNGSQPGAGSETDLAGSLGGSASCPSPMLTMKLADRPLRWAKHRIPVLRRGKGYLFKGTLTCLKKGHRVAPPSGTTVGIYGSRGKRTRWLNGVTVVKGKFHEIVRLRKPGAILFRYAPSGGSPVAVKLKYRLGRRGR